MKYKLIAVDMDGTLLKNNGEISENTLSAIRDVCDRGIRFVVSSGRPVPGIRKYDFLNGIDSSAIVYNGGKIIDLKTDEVLYSQGLYPDDARKILALGDALGTTMCIWSDEKLYCNVLNERTEKYKRHSGLEPIKVTDREALISQGIAKILWYDETERVQQFVEIMGNESFESVSCFTSNPAYLEICNALVSKAKAMEKLGEIYGIDREEMIAVGDGENDLSMIEYAGLGIAMANASEKVKSKADYITASNEDEGVAKVLYKFFSGKEDANENGSN